MPLNVRRYCTFVFIIFAIFVSGSQAQTPPEQTAQAPIVGPPTSGDIMRARISKAKAYIAIRNFHAAIYELENIRRESSDDAVRGVVHGLLMNSYLEQGDFKRAQDLLTEFYNIQKTTRPNAMAAYLAVAGQVVKSARGRAERYKALGLSVSDRMLPLEALNDLEKMRETLELVVTHSKEISQNKEKAGDAMSLLEEATASRSMIGRDDYDTKRWRDVVGDTREQMASSRSVVMSAVHDPALVASKPVDSGTIEEKAVEPRPVETKTVSLPVSQPVADTSQPATPPVVENNGQSGAQPANNDQTALTREREVKTPSETTVAQNEKPIIVPSAPPTVKEEPKKVEPERQPQTAASPTPSGPSPVDTSPVDAGSLIPYATNKAQPVYPAAAKIIRASGIVKVEVMIDEKGSVASVTKTTGPPMLQDAAKDAVRKWKFKPFLRDGQPVKANGFVSFNFNM